MEAGPPLLSANRKVSADASHEHCIRKEKFTEDEALMYRCSSLVRAHVRAVFIHLMLLPSNPACHWLSAPRLLVAPSSSRRPLCRISGRSGFLLSPLSSSSSIIRCFVIQEVTFQGWGLCYSYQYQQPCKISNPNLELHTRPMKVRCTT